MKSMVIRAFLLGVMVALVAACVAPVTPEGSMPTIDAAATEAAPVGSQEKVIFGLDWAFVGQHVPFFVAAEKGFWTEEGLDVEIVRGYGSADAVQKVAAGATTIGYGDTGALVVGRSEGIPVKLVGMVLGLPPHSVIYKMDTPINTPKDLEGKKIGAAAGDSVRRVFPAFAQIAGFDINQVQFETIGYEVYSASLLSGRIDGLAEYYAAKPNYDAAAAENGIELGILKFADYGLDIYSNGFLVQESLIAQNPELVRSFLLGVYRGFDYAYQNPEEAVDIMMKYAPTLDRDVVMAQFLLDKPAVLNDDVLANGYGHIDVEKMQRTIDIMAQAYEITENIPTAAEMFTNEFLPSPEILTPRK
ncbi:ABC transporter substrate-binding protein [Caldilinea sp.]|jgi:NitT/TauT family transport system substrate-binding protein|uniref:ABC transporter substrate-binding protein n=1 Tax=Caldilinea sp. TaxID=2293560 RepID=UPI0021DD759D|nr:ABC transporter substrate-binding protein [Caldilinea sp.]GIV69798.1 MAG: ABC transporter substrate-binding protein [Caldilinea sp.]